MLSKINTAVIHGAEAIPVRLETDTRKGMPTFQMVGNPEPTLREARERIRAAIGNSGFEYPSGHVVINMMPADLRKRGSHLDLPMALGILAAGGQILQLELSDYGVFGELSLDGSIHRVPGILPMMLTMKESGFRGAVVPYGNAEEAALVQGMEILAVSSLKEITDHFNRVRRAEPYIPYGPGVVPEDSEEDFRDVRGQECAKRALTIAAAGGHGVLMTGSPAAGKTMLARRVPTILPEMTYEEIMEVTRIYSVAGLLTDEMPVMTKRPFRQPHTRITAAGLVGGGTVPVPGEISLAHQGVLFLDELGEYQRGVLEHLRQPMEDKQILISRTAEKLVFPADFLLIAATNPCRCGYYGDPGGRCRCTRTQVEQYQGRLTGPVLDRIDLHLYLEPIDYRSLAQGNGSGSETMREQVQQARKIQYERLLPAGLRLNHQMNYRQAEELIHMTDSAEKLMEKIYSGMRLNPRNMLRIKKVARTIADLSGNELVTEEHLAEAAGYRRKEDVL